MNRSSLLGLSLLLGVISCSCGASVSGKDTNLKFSGFSGRQEKDIPNVKGHFEGNLQQIVSSIAPHGWSVDVDPSLDGFSKNNFSWDDHGQWTHVLNRFLNKQKIKGLVVWPQTRIELNKGGVIPHPVQIAPAPTSLANPTEWHSTVGSTLHQNITSWAAQAPCPEATNWVVIWDSQFDYRIDTPLTFSGSFESLLSQVFDLYKTAQKPLYAQANRTQCVLSVSDKPSSDKQ